MAAEPVILVISPHARKADTIRLTTVRWYVLQPLITDKPVTIAAAKPVRTADTRHHPSADKPAPASHMRE